MNVTTTTRIKRVGSQVFLYGSAVLSAAAIAYIANTTVFGAETHAVVTSIDTSAKTQLDSLSTSKQSSLRYICPMHPEMQSHTHGDECPICGMKMLADEKCDIPDTQSAGSVFMSAMKQARPSVRMASAMVNRLGVRSEKVQLGSMHRRVETPGFIQQLSDEGRSRYQISAAGRMDSLHVRAGDWVMADQALFSWSSPQLVKAQKFHLRLMETLGHDSASLKGSKDRLVALGMSDQDLAALEQAGTVFESVTVKARIEGRVMQLSLREGESFSKGQLLFSVGGIVRASVLANAFQRDAAWIRPGQRAEIRLQGRGKAYPAVVSQGAVSINPNSQNIGVKLSFSAPIDDVRQAMYVSGVIFDQLHDEVLTVPLESVIWQPEGNRVILDRGNGLFQPVAVALGDEVDGRVVVREGLTVDDRVVSSAQFLIDSESNLRTALNRLDAKAHH